MASAVTPRASIKALSKRIASRARPAAARQMIDAGVHVDPAAVALRAVLMRVVVHLRIS
jgi:hypothetical protein